MRIAICQTTPKLGAIQSNAEALLHLAQQAYQQGADWLVTSELALQGYPPRDLLDEPHFVQESIQASQYLQRHSPLPMVLGTIVSDHGDPFQLSQGISNGALWLMRDQSPICHRKCRLPFYDIFDDMRYFVPGQHPTTFTYGSAKFHLTICEDIWGHLPQWQSRSVVEPMAKISTPQPQGIINLSASPFVLNKQQQRYQAAQQYAARHAMPLLYVNQMAAYDRIVFDGASFASTAQGQITFQAPAFLPHLELLTFDGQQFLGAQHHREDRWQQDALDAILLALRHFFTGHPFRKVVVGLSGGIDSALTAALAVLALGPQRVEGIRLPSPFTSQHAMEDALASAELLNIPLRTLPITPTFETIQQQLPPPWLQTGTTLENIQARIRGTLLMAMANAEQALLLTTSNKSEIAVGYATLYGDMCGGFNLLGDLYKTDVFALARYINTLAPMIPQRSIDKPPSAELRDNQKDSDSLPPYTILDPILQHILEYKTPLPQLTQLEGAKPWLPTILQLVRQSEHKRWQMAPTVKLRQRSFGEGWRYPLNHGYQDGDPSALT